AGFCIHDLGAAASPLWVTSRVVYIRFHGPTERAYTGRYPLAHLRDWAERVAGYQAAGHDVFVYFNNDGEGYAVINARELKSLLAGGMATKRHKKTQKEKASVL